MSAPNRQLVESIHREMMKASIEAAGHDRKLQEHTSQGHGLEPVLRTWVDAARKLRTEVAASKDRLVKDGSPNESVQRALQRLEDLEGRSKDLNVQSELDDTVRSWQGLASEFAALRGVRAHYLISLLQSRQGEVDRATKQLSEARALGGLAPAVARERRELQAVRDLARRRYDDLRQRYLLAEQQFAEAQKTAGEKAPQPAVKEFVLPGGLKLASVAASAAIGQPGKPAPLVLKVPSAGPGAAQPSALVGSSTPKPGVQSGQAQPTARLDQQAAKSGVKQASAQPTAARPAAKRTDVLSPYGGRVTSVDGWREFARGTDGIGQGSATVQVKIAGGGTVPDPQCALSKTVDLGCGSRFTVRTGLQWTGGARPRDVGVLTLTLSATGGALGTTKADAARQRADRTAQEIHAWLRSELFELSHAIADRAAGLAADAIRSVFASAQAAPVAPPKPPQPHPIGPSPIGVRPPIATGIRPPPPPSLPSIKPSLPSIKPAIQQIKPPLSPAATQLPAVQRPSTAPAPGQIRVSLKGGVPPFRTRNPDGFGQGSVPVTFAVEGFGHPPAASAVQAQVPLACGATLDFRGSLQVQARGPAWSGELAASFTVSGGSLRKEKVSPALFTSAARYASNKVAVAVRPLLGQLGASVVGGVAERAAEQAMATAGAGAAHTVARPHAPGVSGPAGATQHHVQKVNAAFAAALEKARSFGHQAAASKPGDLISAAERERDGVAERLQKTIAAISSVTSKSLTDARGSELRTGLAQMDALIGKLQGKKGAELAQGAEELSSLLGQLGQVASGKGGAPHLGSFRKLLQERKASLTQIASKVGKGVTDVAQKVGGLLQPSALAQGKQLEQLKKLYPGLEKMLKGAATGDLAKQLGKLAGLPGGLGAALGGGAGGLGQAAKMVEKGLGGVGTNLFGKLAGPHLGGLGTGHLVGGLGAFMSGGLAQAMTAGQSKLGKSASKDVGKVLAAFQKGGHQGALHEMGKLVEKQKKQLSSKIKHKNHAAITAEALAEAFHDSGKGDFAQHLQKGGALHGILDAAQRQHGKGLGAITSHLLENSGNRKLSSAMSLVEGLVKSGHKPRFSLWDSIKSGVSSVASAASSAVSSVASKVTSVASSVASTASSLAQATAGAVGKGISSVVNVAGNVANRVGGAVTNVVQRAAGGVSQAAKWVGSGVSKVAKGVGSVVGKVADKVSSLGHSVYDTVSEVGHGVYDAASAIGHKVYEAASDLGHNVYDSAKSTLQRVSKTVGGAVNRGLDAASGFVSRTARGVANAVGGAWDTASKVAGSVWGGVKGAVKDTWGGIKNAAGDAWGGVTSAVKDTWSGMKNAAGDVWGGMKNAAGNVWDGMKRGVGSAWDSAKQFGGKVLSGAQQVGGFLVDKASGLGNAVMGGIRKGWGGLQNVAGKVGTGIAGMAGSAWNWAGNTIGSAWNVLKQGGSSLLGGLKSAGGAVLGGLKSAGGAVAGAAKSVGGSIWDGLKGAGSFIADKAKGAATWAANAAKGAGSWIGEKVKGGLEWANKTGIVGALGSGLKKGLSFLGKAAEFTPLGLAMKAGKAAGDWFKGGGLGKLWEGTKNLAGKAWEGIKTGYKATAGFLQSPAGQFLVTGLSLAASFIPGGMLVKGLVGGAIGAISAISEGKDWKGILAGAGSGALQGALPFMKLGPLAKVGIGALQGGLSSVMQGGSLTDVLKGAAGGALDSFDPGALKALKKFKSVSAVEKLVSGKGLSSLEKAATSKGPLRMLEKVMTNPKVRKTIGALENVGGKAVKGGIWLSGKAAQAQGVLDKALSMGDKLSGALGEVQQYAPEIAGMVGDNALGHFINRVGDYAGQGHDKLQTALDYGHTASDKLGEYKGYLDKGLGYVGVKDPQKAYDKMMARKDAARGKKSGIEGVAQQKLEKHREREAKRNKGGGGAEAPHEPTHALAEVTGKQRRAGGGGAGRPPKVHEGEEHQAGPSSGRRGRKSDRSADAPKSARDHGGEHHDAPGKKKGKKGGEHESHEAEGHEGSAGGKKGKKRGHPAEGGEHHDPAPKKRTKGGKGAKSLLDRAVAKGKQLQQKGVALANKADQRLGQLHDVVGKGLEGAQKIQGGLEKAAELAGKGAELLGEDNELGKYLKEVHDKAEQVHGYLETGIGYAESFNEKVEKGQGMLHKIPGVGHGEDEGGEGEHEESGGASGGKKKRKKKTKGGADASPLEQATHLEGGKGKKGKDTGEGASGKGHPAGVPANESPEQKSKRGQEAWDKIGYVSGAVQKYETKYKSTLVKIQRLLADGKSGEASKLLMDLGGECDQLNGVIKDAKAKAAGFASYEKEIKFYEGWHKQAKEKVYAAIAETKGIGDHAAISGFGIDAKSHPDIFANNAKIFGVQAKVIAFANSLGDEDAKAHVQAVLGEAKAAKTELQTLKAKYRKDKAATHFLSGGAAQDSLIDESIKKLEAALGGHGKDAGAKGKDKGGKDRHGAGGKDSGGEGKHSLMGKVEGGLEALEKYKKKAIKAGKQVDKALVKVEAGLKKGIKIGKKVDGGLVKASDLANKLGDFLGDDSALGHLAHQAGGASDTLHEKLHGALNLAKKGKSGVHKGRELLEQALGKAKEHHETEAGKGAKKAEEHIKKEVFEKHDQELVKHHRGEHKKHHEAAEKEAGKQDAHAAEATKQEADAARQQTEAAKQQADAAKAHGARGKGHPHAPHGAHGHGGHAQPGRGHPHEAHGHGAHGAHGRRGHDPHHRGGHQPHRDPHGPAPQEQHDQAPAPHADPHGHQPEHGRRGRGHSHRDPHHRGKGGKHPHHGKGHKGHPHGHHGKQEPHHDEAPHAPGGAGEKGGGFDIGALIAKAGSALDKFSKGVSKGIPFVEKLLHGNDHKSAGDKVQGVSSLSELARLALSEALKAAQGNPAVKKQIDALHKAYSDIKGHFHKFIGGLHGLAGQMASGGIDAKKYPDLAAVEAAIEALKAKASALGDAAQKAPDPKLSAALHKEADALHKKLIALQAKYAKDSAASQLVSGVMGKLGEVLALLGGKGKGKGKQDPAQQAGGGPTGGGEAPAPKKKRSRRRRRGHKHLTHADTGSGQGDHAAVHQIGQGGRVFVDRGGHRGESDHHDGQDVDPAAMDTWLGSGEGIKNFSEVFGAFLPAEGATENGGTSHASGGGGGGGGGADHGGGEDHGGYDTPEDGEVVEHDGGDDGDEDDDGGDEEDEHGGGGGLLETVGGMIGKAGKFAKGLLGKAGKFAKGLLGKAGKFAKGMLGKAGKFAKGLLGKAGKFAKGMLGKAGKFAKGLFGKVTKGAGGFLGKMFGGLHGLADKVGGLAKMGQKFLGKGMHFAEMGMGFLNKVGDVTGKVQDYAGKAEGFLDKIGLHGLAGFAGKIGGAAGWVGEKAEQGHDILKKADDLMGQGKKGLGAVGKIAGTASKLFSQAEKGHFGGFLNLFKASRNGPGIDGRTTPERFSGSSAIDDPQRLDGITLHRMESFLGGSFSDVKIHTGKGAAEVTKRYDAEAVTVKDHIFFAPGRFNPGTAEGERLIAHELTHVMQKGRPNLDVKTAEGEALSSERKYGNGPQMQTLNLGKPQADFTFSDGEGAGAATGVHTAKRTRSKANETGGQDVMPDGEEMIEKVSERVYELLMEELEQAFESR